MLDRQEFFQEYKVEHEFEISGLKWEVLEEIYDDFCNRKKNLEARCNEFVDYYTDGMQIEIHSIRTRAKDPKHLIEKIIRKRGRDQSRKYENISVDNYMNVIHDLMGARILILAKEQWEGVFDWTMDKFMTNATQECYLAEPPVAYTRYGDRDIFGNKIYREHTERGYRSQHYVVRFKEYFCEIQVRTLAEEVYGEFDHKVKYPYRNDNHFLKRYTNTVSQLTDSIDEIISTCFGMGEKGWESCDQYYEKDTYVDWRNIAQNDMKDLPMQEKKQRDEEVDAVSYVNSLILRKGRNHA